MFRLLSKTIFNLQLKNLVIYYWQFYIHCSVHHCNCLKNNKHDVTCGLSFIFMGSRHSFSTCSAEHVGEREGYNKDYTLYQRLTVQEK